MEWTLTTDAACMCVEVGGQLNYGYVRNYMDFAADEAFGEANESGGRQVAITSATMQVDDVISKWRWWPVDGVIPEIDTSSYLATSPEMMPRNDFITSIALPDFWWPHFSPTVQP